MDETETRLDLKFQEKNHILMKKMIEYWLHFFKTTHPHQGGTRPIFGDETEKSDL